MQPTATTETLRQQLRQAIVRLSEEHLVEVMHFVDYLQYREQAQQIRPKVVALEGLWKDIPFDITHDDVRTLRHQVTQQAARKVSLTLTSCWPQPLWTTFLSFMTVSWWVRQSTFKPLC